MIYTHICHAIAKTFIYMFRKDKKSYFYKPIDP